jgi:uncharacterized membrane protein YkoI
MISPRRRVVSGACLLLVAAFPSHAGGLRAQEPVGQELPIREGISEDAAVALVREQTDGKVVRVRRKVDGESLVYHIRVITPDGRVREYRVDAATGTVR